MAYKNITDNTARQVEIGYVRKAIIQVNKALTGTIAIYDATSGTSPLVATITDPTVGSRFEYHGLQTGFRVVASGSCDITAETEIR